MGRKVVIEAANAIFQSPPFPGSVKIELVRKSSAAQAFSLEYALQMLAAMRRHRVGGPFWLADEETGNHQRDLWKVRPEPFFGEDPLALLAAIAGHRPQVLGESSFAQLNQLNHDATHDDNLIASLIRQTLLSGISYHDPFTESQIEPMALVEILGSWRGLIDRNRPIAAAFGFASWKRETVAPLLWGGRPVPFRPARLAELDKLGPSDCIAVWKARVPSAFLEALESGPWTIIEIEDGFIRSAGLGADCVPPLSITADRQGVHYDPSRPSELETLLEEGRFNQKQIERAAAFREWLVHNGVSKYGVGKGSELTRPGGAAKHILVTGQVEDDRSVLSGGSEVRSNLALLQRVRASSPDAYVIYRPHPDVQAGHRVGSIPLEIANKYADLIDGESPISALIAMADEVHVITSLAGFEALLHGKPVVTHGTPFFSGWGLTRDLAIPPGRRSRHLSIDELTAGALLAYPRYLDPTTGYPCTPEVLVSRLISGVRRGNGALVQMRQFIGWMKRATSPLLD